MVPSFKIHISHALCTEILQVWTFSHQLRIEIAGYPHIALEDICQHCNQEVESGYHFICNHHCITRPAKVIFVTFGPLCRVMEYYEHRQFALLKHKGIERASLTHLPNQKTLTYFFNRYYEGHS